MHGFVRSICGSVRVRARMHVYECGQQPQKQVVISSDRYSGIVSCGWGRGGFSDTSASDDSRDSCARRYLSALSRVERPSPDTQPASKTAVMSLSPDTRLATEAGCLRPTVADHRHHTDTSGVALAYWACRLLCG